MEEEKERNVGGRPEAEDKMVGMPLRVRKSMKELYDSMTKEIKANILKGTREAFDKEVEKSKEINHGKRRRKS